MGDSNTARLSPAQAVGRAFWMVNLPVLIVMFGPAAALFGVGSLFTENSELSAKLKLGSFAAFLVCWPLAWLAWSILTPRWRVWAYQRVSDLNALKQDAVAARVIWPEGHIFERTELRPPRLRKQLQALEDAHQETFP